jgi:hypothetical protein
MITTIPSIKIKRKTQKQQKQEKQKKYKLNKYKTKINSKGGAKKGKGFFKAVFTKTVPATYTNIKYSTHNTTFPGIDKLICPICKRHVFKLHRLKIATYGKGIFLRGNFWNDSFNLFKCTDCGHAMMFSNDISYNEDTNDISHDEDKKEKTNSRDENTKEKTNSRDEDTKDISSKRLQSGIKKSQKKN